jgi:hypothetical protein
MLSTHEAGVPTSSAVAELMCGQYCRGTYQLYGDSRFVFVGFAQGVGPALLATKPVRKGERLFPLIPLKPYAANSP